MISTGAFGSTWVEKEETGGKLSAVKRLKCDSTVRTLLALVTLADVGASGVIASNRHQHLFIGFHG